MPGKSSNIYATSRNGYATERKNCLHEVIATKKNLTSTVATRLVHFTYVKVIH